MNCNKVFIFLKHDPQELFYDLAKHLVESAPAYSAAVKWHVNLYQDDQLHETVEKGQNMVYVYAVIQIQMFIDIFAA